MKGFTKGERLLWCGSVGAILLAFFLFDGRGWLTLTASLIGVTSLLFSAKGNPVGQVLMVLFILLWLLAARWDSTCFSVVVCFAAFLINDLYGFLSWRRMSRRQALR